MKSRALIALGTLLFSACANDAGTLPMSARYVLIDLKEPFLINGPAIPPTIADTLILVPAQHRAYQTIVYQVGGALQRVSVERYLEVLAGAITVNFDCVADAACPAIYGPSFGTIRGDTLEFLQNPNRSRTYVKR